MRTIESLYKKQAMNLILSFLSLLPFGLCMQRANEDTGTSIHLYGLAILFLFIAIGFMIASFIALDEIGNMIQRRKL